MPLVLGPLLVGLLPFLAALVLLGLSQATTSYRGSDESGSYSDFITGKTFLHQLSGFASSFARWIVSHFAALNQVFDRYHLNESINEEISDLIANYFRPRKA